ncbi:MAG TPA: GNAT family N-acetyltransferase [Dehalococcoidia bacterium]
MSVQIRPLRDDEWEQRAFIDSYAFGGDRGPAAVERLRREYRAEWTLVAIDGGEMVASLVVIPFAMGIEGRPVPMGGVASVATLPEHRRKGHVGRLLRQALADMRERGQVLSALYTPHPPLYRRFGWAYASANREYRFACKDLSLRSAPPEGGRVRRADAGAIPKLAEVYARWSAGRTGPLERTPERWQQGVLNAWDPEFDIAVWENGSGGWDGYVLYRAWQPDILASGQHLLVRELAACTPEAYQGLVHFLLHHDRVTDARWLAPPDDAFLALVTDPSRVQPTHLPGFMLRLVDVPAALAARPYTVDGTLVLEVRDATAPWNQGRWRLAVREGRATVEPGGGEPDLALDAADLAPLYDGYWTASALALAGLIGARSPEALELADRLFATRTPPFMPEFF